MPVLKLKKCPTCMGIGACNEGDKCPTCEGTGEVPSDEVIIDDPCQPVIRTRLILLFARRVMKTNRSEAVIAANGKVANRYLLCSVAGRAARSFQIAGKLSSQAITEVLQMVGEGEVIRTKAVKLPMAA